MYLFSSLSVISTNTAKLNPLVLKLLLSFLARPGWSRDTNDTCGSCKAVIQLPHFGYSL